MFSVLCFPTLCVRRREILHLLLVEYLSIFLNFIRQIEVYRFLERLYTVAVIFLTCTYTSYMCLSLQFSSIGFLFTVSSRSCIMVLSTPSVAYTLMVTEPTISPRHLYVSVQAESVWYMSMYTDVHAHRISILCSFILSFLYKRVSFPVIVAKRDNI